MGARIVFVGDDFTGASDSLAAYARRGLRTRLVTGTTAPEVDLDVLGIATDLRSLTPERAIETLNKLWPMIEAEAPEIIHFKVCSTFDSSPDTGSIGAVAQALRDMFHPDVTAVIGGQPGLGRYCAFGTLFARGPDGIVHRIDRHPVMARHPVTPMTEADLAVHLAAQGLVLSERITAPDLRDPQTVAARLAQAPALLDTIDAEDQRRIGAALDRTPGRKLLIGASSVAEVLGGDLGSDPPLAPAPRKGRTLLFAGSRSSVTADQIAATTTLTPVALTPDALADPDTPQRIASKHGDTDLLVHLLHDADYGVSPDALADACADLVQKLAGLMPLRALGLAGGDTSSRIVARMGFDALDFQRDLGQGACICLGHHKETRLDGLPMMLKGGQMGSRTLFDDVAALF